MEMSNILVIGANGQLGSELVIELRNKFGHENVIATDIQKPEDDTSPFEILDIMQADKLSAMVAKHQISEIYLLAAMLSAKAEQMPQLAWDLNIVGLLNVLNIAKENTDIKVYWPSSIGAFGPSTPKQNTPQECVMDPNTVYGISKLAGERWCEYYNEKYGVDVRSLRYPGLIGYKSLPGGGTTDYAVDIFYKAIHGEDYECFLKEDAYLPMMYMSDAVNATIAIMEAPSEKIKLRSSYNLASMSFSPIEIYNKIREKYPEFQISYKPDFRQAIAESWPHSIDDSRARNDWGWQHQYDLDKLVDVMLVNLETKLALT
jgi:nucleoside-diphosphate-sugar epimerase